ncbi:hypothetical protein OV450_3442 [Actinobacteria bacterium OV450]|nr:hypothetical protein OV450_3442 [Actinobacteria bacterium OV450]
MERFPGYEHVTGTREELINELEDRAEGWHHMGSDRKRDRALEAAQALRDGSFSVKVGHRIYSVTGAAVPPSRSDTDAETTDTPTT